ncbi:NAD(P)H-binding protein [Flavobacterium chilense]|uniref:NAD(P)H-binding n=1 Tax=Flavobacterium chilense TaxID=946677 RepID=A0A1M6XLR4_9FLAO|nr:NAD(P)H-binding protein [Flavobacterium chilense]SHL06891.1 NAD(P)H-binding [Flavobacterium chilense]
MKALVIGATGATGKDLINVLLNDPEYTEIVAFVRKTSNTNHFKLKEILTDFENLESITEFINGDVLFSCLGTTSKMAGSQANQWHIDYEIPLNFAKIARKRDILRTVLLSAYGASVNSKVVYSKIKGKLEEDIEKLSFNQYIIFRPASLLRKETDRRDERIIISVLKMLNSFGILKKFSPLPTDILAEKLAKSPKTLPNRKCIVELENILDF